MRSDAVDIVTPRQVGKSALRVTPHGFGSGPFGYPQIPHQQCLEAVQAAWDEGVRFFDTAPFYGIGRSERRLGLGLSECGDRAEYAVNTKVGRTLEPEPVVDDTNATPTPDGSKRTPRDRRSGHRVHFDYSYEGITRQHRDSLQRLGMSRVNGLTIHDLDYGYQSPEQIEHIFAELSQQGGARALAELRAADHIQAIGAGCNREMRNHASWEGGLHEDLIERLADNVDLDFLVIAGPYTLLDTIALRRVLPLCEARNMGAIIASPYAGGWLVDPESHSYMYGETPDQVREKSAALAAVCRDFEVPLAAVALQFPLAHPAVAAVIPGARSPAEARSAAEHLRIPIPPALWDVLKEQRLLDEAAPTPSGP